MTVSRPGMDPGVPAWRPANEYVVGQGEVLGCSLLQAIVSMCVAGFDTEDPDGFRGLGHSIDNAATAVAIPVPAG